MAGHNSEAVIRAIDRPRLALSVVRD